MWRINSKKRVSILLVCQKFKYFCDEKIYVLKNVKNKKCDDITCQSLK